MSKTTIVTGSGKEVTGEVVRTESPGMTLIEGLACIATLGLSEIGSQSTTTVKDERGNHFTGHKK